MVKRFKSEQGKQLVYDSYDRLLAAWETEKKELDMDTPFGKTHVVTAGEITKPPLLLFHGTADDLAMMWIYNIKELAKHFYVIAVDTMGGPGKSEPNEKYFKEFEVSLWVNSLLDALGVGATHICGVSYGTQLAQNYAINNPERVNNLVCLAGGVPVEDKGKSLWAMMRVFLPEAMFPSEKNVKKLIKKLSGPCVDCFEKNTELMNHYLYLLKYFNNKSMFYHRFPEFTRQQIASLKEKILFLMGDCDRLAVYTAAVQALEAYGLPYKIIKDAGHGINHEQPELINREIIDFLLHRHTLRQAAEYYVIR